MDLRSQKNIKLRLLFGMFFLCSSLFSQQLLTGTVRDENNIPIPYAKVYIKNSADQKNQANSNGVYEMRLMPGEYFLVYTALGYEDRESYAIIKNSTEVKDIQLFPMSIQDMQDVEVSAKKSNPGREIMLKVVEKRDKLNPWSYPHNVKVYIKAAEKIEYDYKGKNAKNEEKQKQKNLEKEKKKKKKTTETSTGSASGTEGTTNSNKEIEDPFAQSQKKIIEESNKLNLVEIQLDRSFSPQNKVKEIRNAYTKRGSDRDLYYTTTVKSNFNFFENLLHLDDLHQSPVSSPISTPGILSYKYRLEAQYEEGGYKIHKIKIIPRITSTSTLSGYIYVIDSLWLIQKLELTMEKGNLLKYDNFTIQQEFENVGDSLCVLKRQNLIYGLTYGGNKSNFKTEAIFSDYDFKVKFPPKYFSNELAVTEKEAYERDSTFWKENRVLELSEEEKRFIIVKDSIKERLNRKEYLDSIDGIFNKVTPWKVLWFGVDHRNRVKQVQWTINSIAATARPINITGPRVAPGFSYYKKWDNQKFIDLYSEISLGLKDNSLFTQHWFRYRYNPFKYSTLSLSFRNDIDAIRNYDAISQILNANNFYKTTSFNIGHDFELVNGLFFNCDFNFSERKSLDGSEYFGFLDSTELKTGSYFSDFETYQGLKGDFTLSYTPQQKYMREPYRKVILGSKWPTLYVNYKKGFENVFGSDINFDYLLFGMYQSFQIKTFGTTNYHIKTGKFLSSKHLYEVDFIYNRRSDPIWFSNPLYSFQQLAKSLPSEDIFYEAHFIHHDNGGIINKIPYMKKLNLGLVFGGGALYVKEFDYFHTELLAGIERNFKFSKRRLRIGIYGVASEGNQIKPTSTFKVSFAVLDDRSMKWNF
ncbi:MAG: DUF5686 family protein [Bacteroidota bacterium]